MWRGVLWAGPGAECGWVVALAVEWVVMLAVELVVVLTATCGVK